MLAGGLALTLAGITWLSTITAGTPYLTGVALPMVLIGVGQGLGFAPLTAAGIAGASANDAGAASGLVNTSHQLGSALGVSILVALSANASSLAGSAAIAYTGGIDHAGSRTGGGTGAHHSRGTHRAAQQGV